jgi:hypothetical protein
MPKSFRIGIYDDEERFISSVKTLIDKGYPIYDVFTPYPVHEIFDLLKRRTRIPTAGYFFGLIGAIATLSFLIWACVISWPINYGGKPFNSFPSFVVITIVITILFVAIGSLALFSARAKVLPGRGNTIFDRRSSDNMFVIAVEVISTDDPEGEMAGNLMLQLGAEEVYFKELEQVTA